MHFNILFKSNKNKVNKQKKMKNIGFFRIWRNTYDILSKNWIQLPVHN